MRRLDVGRKRSFLIFGGVLCMGIAGFFVARALWPTTRPSLEQGQRDQKFSPPQERLEGKPKPAGAFEASVSKQGSTQQGPVEDLNSEAIDVAGRLMRDFPDDPDAIAVMAMVHHRFGNTAGAVKCLERCLQLNPRSADAYHGMGSVAFKMGEYEKAAALQRKALEIDPTLVGAGVQLADALSGLGKFEEAVAVLENDTKVFPKTAGMLSRLGAAYHRLEEYEKAKKNYQAAIESDPALPDAYYGLAKVYAKLGQREESRAFLKKYKELADPDRKARIERARLLGDRAVVVARESLADIYTAAGQIYHRHGDARNAEGHWLKAARLFPEDAVCREELLSLYQQTNRTADTLPILEQLGEIDPGNVTYQLHMGVLNARLSRFDAAESAFQKVRELAPERPEGYLALVRLYLQSNRKLPEAAKLARAAVELAPTALNYVLLSAACKRNDDHAGAVSAIERAMELDPGNDEYRRIQESLREQP